MSLRTALDHLVIVARNLEEGVAWCETTLGIAPSAGGEHVLFGTHNRIFSVASNDFPRVYCEIIAINSRASPIISQGAKRWFDMDDPALQAAVSQTPRLVHFVANTSNLKLALSTLNEQSIDRGDALAASRMTAQGLLEWLISVRSDGQRLFHGALPTLIEWGAVHPSTSLPNSGVMLRSLAVSHRASKTLQSAYQSLGLRGISVSEGAANLIAEFDTPKGITRLESGGI